MSTAFVLSALFAAALASLAVFGLVPLFLAGRLRRHIEHHRREPEPAAGPRTAVILPCRGVDDSLAACLASIFAQRPAPHQVLLVTTAGDAALPLLHRAEDEHPGVATVVIAPRATRSAQKLCNQLAAVAALSPQAEAVVCIDSDGVLPEGFLARMVSHLGREGVGAVTGWRWYVPGERAGLATRVRSAWNAGAMPFLVDGSYNIAFGGAMAIRCDLLRRSGVLELWQRTVSDGLSLAYAVKRAGLAVHFDPRCIVVSREADTWASVLEWTSRQATISRCCMPAFWRFTAIAHAATIAVLIAATVLGAWAVGWAGAAMALGLYLALLGANALLIMSAVAGVLDRSAADVLRRDRWRYLLAAPLAAWLYGLNIIRSALSRTITWRGITYRLNGPEDIAIVGAGMGKAVVQSAGKHALQH